MLKNIEDAKAFAQSILGNFAIIGKSTVEFIKYRENYVFKATNLSPDAITSNYAIRVHRRHYRSDEELIAEAAFVERLVASGITVPKQILTTSSEPFLVKPDSQGDEYQIDVQEWINGTQPFDDVAYAFDGSSTRQADDFFRLGQLAATVHQKTRKMDITHHFKRHAWDCDGLIGKNAVWGDPLRAFINDDEKALIKRALDKITHYLNQYGKSKDNYGPIHADLTPENILIKQDNDLLLIDFDDCGFGWYIFDLTTALTFYQPHPQFTAFEKALFAGYETISPLDEETRKVWPALLLARGMTYLGWAYDRLGDEASDFLLNKLKPFLLVKAKQFIEE